MTEPKPIEAQIVYERIEELKASGMTNADAIREVAEERGKRENAVRANQHAWRQKLARSATVTKRRAANRKSTAVSVEDAVAEAKRLLEQALGAIDDEVEAAKAEVEAAQSRYDALLAAAKERKAGLVTKIKALG